MLRFARHNALQSVLLSTWKIVAIVSTLALSGCGGPPERLMTPTMVSANGAKLVPIVVATTRLPSEDSGIMFTGARGDLGFANVVISVPPNHVSGEIEWPTSLPVDPNKYFATHKAELLSASQFPAAVRQNIRQFKSGGRVLVFIHGYNTRFDAAVLRLAQIALDNGSMTTPVLFTWPSRGKLLGYPYDRESVAYSRDALETVLRDLAREPSVSDITVMAHSMGNMVALEALKQMAVRDGHVARKIKNVVLASPDVDIDVAKTLIGGMGSNPPTFNLFISRDDKALAASRLVWGSTDRLGQIDLSQERYRQSLAGYKNMNIFDLTELQTGDSLNHTKFAESPEVVRFLGTYMMSGRPLDTGKIGLGDHIGTFVVGASSILGNAAATAVAAPISLVDPATRGNFSDRLEATVPKSQ